jgi:hypothetical protein
MREPLMNVPPEVRDGLVAVLDGAVNVRNRLPKRFKFGSSRSEDALTWTVVEGLRRLGRLDALLPPAARIHVTSVPPSVLAWGHPVAGNNAHQVADALCKISQDLGESAASRSEPDVIVVWPSLVTFVEVKLDSSNDRQPLHSAFPAYVDDDHDLYRRPDAVASAGLYELTRNWTLAARLASMLQSSMLLLNLGPPAISADAAEFAVLLEQTATRRFAFRDWNDVLEDATPLPAWLAVYIQSTGFPIHS